MGIFSRGPAPFPGGMLEFGLMNRLNDELFSLAEHFARVAQDLTEAWSGQAGEAGDESGRADPLIDAMGRLFDSLKRFDIPTSSRRGSVYHQVSVQTELSDLIEYGFELLTKLAGLAMDLGLPGQSREIQAMVFPLALWLARQGGEIRVLAPIVNGLSVLANSSSDPLELEQLWHQTTEILEAVSPASIQETEAQGPNRPWRLLLFNWGIIATRSLRPSLMTRAFDAIIEQLPEDAPSFFREGMEQMAALPYPPHVREVMERYFGFWNQPRLLH